MYGANYNGKQPNNTSYIKNFIYGVPLNLWKVLSYTKPDGNVASVITTASDNYESLYIKGDIYCDGNIIQPSDSKIKKDICSLTEEQTNKLLQLKVIEYKLINDDSAKKHYGLIAQELEQVYPELVQEKPVENGEMLKSVNYLELIPILLRKIQIMQEVIDSLEQQIGK